MKSYIRKIATSPLGVKLRNLTGWRSVPISFAHLQKNATVSDGFIWRVNENFTTKFNFADLLPLFTNSSDNTIILEFFDHLNRPIKTITLENLVDVSQEIIIDSSLLNTTGYGSFYIYHTSNSTLQECITFSNRCYVGYSYQKNLYSNVHGNTYVKSKGINNEKVEGNMIQSSGIRKYQYTLQNSFKGFDKTELVFVNPHNYTVKMELNGLKHRLSPYEVKVIEFKDDIATIRGQSYFLRPIVFNYLNGRIDVYHT